MATPFKICAKCGQRAVLSMAVCGRCGEFFPAQNPFLASSDPEMWEISRQYRNAHRATWIYAIVAICCPIIGILGLIGFCFDLVLIVLNQEKKKSLRMRAAQKGVDVDTWIKSL